MSTQKLTFKTTLLLAKKTATGIQVPDEIVEKLGAGKRPPVSVTINDYSYPSTIAVMGGMFMLPVSAEVRQNARVQAGESIEVTLQLDVQPREVDLPDDFQKALNSNQIAR